MVGKCATQLRCDSARPRMLTLPCPALPCVQATMAATWLTELLLDTLNRALLQQGAGGVDQLPAGTTDGVGGANEDGSAYQQVCGFFVKGCCFGPALTTCAWWLPACSHPTCQPPIRLPACPAPAAHSTPSPILQAVERLRAFLQKYVDVLDPGTTVGLLAGYGRLDELMHYARCRGDWEGLLEYLLQRQEVRCAPCCCLAVVAGGWQGGLRAGVQEPRRLTSSITHPLWGRRSVRWRSSASPASAPSSSTSLRPPWWPRRPRSPCRPGSTHSRRWSPGETVKARTEEPGSNEIAEMACQVSCTCPHPAQRTCASPNCSSTRPPTLCKHTCATPPPTHTPTHT